MPIGLAWVNECAGIYWTTQKRSGHRHPNDLLLRWAKAAQRRELVVDKPLPCTVQVAAGKPGEALRSDTSVFIQRWDSDFNGLVDQQRHWWGCVTSSRIFDRFRPQVPALAEQAGPGSGIGMTSRRICSFRVVVLFGLPVSITVDLAQLCPARCHRYFM